MNRKFIAILLTFILCISVVAPVSALTSTTTANWYPTFLYFEESVPVPFVVHLGGKLFLTYSNYTNPWPGYQLVERNELDSIVYNYYAPYPIIN